MENNKGKKPLPRMTIVGLCLFAACMVALFFAPNGLNQGFNAMVEYAHPIVINTGLLSTMSTSIIISVIIGRLLERLGFTDAMIRVDKPNGDFFYAVPYDTDEIAYMVKVDVKVDDNSHDDDDKDYYDDEIKGADDIQGGDDDASDTDSSDDDVSI